LRDFHVTGVQTCALPISILAVLGVLLSLIWAIIPLFASGKVESSDKLAVPHGISSGVEPFIAAATDEHQLLAWVVSATGKLTVFRLGTGEVLQQRELFEDGPALSAYSRPSIRSIDGGPGNRTTQV